MGERDPAEGATALRPDLAFQIEPRRDDPNILGWSYQSESEALITDREIAAILSAPTATSSKQALLDYALDSVYGGSLTSLSAAWDLPLASREALYAAAPGSRPR